MNNRIYLFIYLLFCSQEIGNTHEIIADGLTTLLQMSGLIARLCMAAKGFKK